MTEWKHATETLKAAAIGNFLKEDPADETESLWDKLTDQESTLAQFSVKIDVLRSERDAAQAKLAAIRAEVNRWDDADAGASIRRILDGSGT